MPACMHMVADVYLQDITILLFWTCTSCVMWCLHRRPTRQVACHTYYLC